MTHARLRAALVALALPLLSGCGGADIGAATPAFAAKTPSAEDLGTVDGASAAVDHAERAIDDLLGPTWRSTAVAQKATAPPGPAQDAPSPPPPPPAAAAPPSVAESSLPRPSDKNHREGLKQEAVAADACSTACSALASMERATEHLCDLAGAEDARCTTARTRVQNASRRVRAACPVCSGP